MRLLVSRNLVTKVLEALFNLENHRVGFVNLVDAFLFLSVGSSISSSLVLHTLDFFVRQATRSLDADALFLACSLILSRHIQDAVSIDFESNFDLRNAAWCRSNAIEVELAESLVVLSHWTFALKHMYFNRRLIVGSRRECFALASRNCGVCIDELSHHATQCFDTNRQWNNVEQKHVLNVAAEHTALNSSTHSHNLVGVNTLRWSLAEELFNNFLYGRNTG